MKKKSKYNVIVVGVGAVGIEMLRILKLRKFPIDKLRVLARSEREIEVDGDKYQVEAIGADKFDGYDIALFAGTEGEKGAAVTFAPEAKKSGCLVIDNGADFRMAKDVPLVVPEANGEDAKANNGIIANPNCTTIQMMVALAPIHREYGLEQIVVSSYQAASGAGRSAIAELSSQIKEIAEGKPVSAPEAMNHQLAGNVIPQIGGFSDLEYTSEEWKCVKETKKILHDDEIKVTATCVRVPVANCHSEAIWIKTKKNPSVADIRKLLGSSASIKLVDNPEKSEYPMALNVSGQDDVYVGRVRKDPSIDGAFWLWVVADNLRKGAALNAIQIAEYLINA